MKRCGRQSVPIERSGRRLWEVMAKAYSPPLADIGPSVAAPYPAFSGRPNQVWNRSAAVRSPVTARLPSPSISGSGRLP